MKRFALLIIATVLLLIMAIPAQAQFTYWIAYTNELSCQSGHSNRIYGISTADSNQVDVDYDNDGAVDDSWLLNEAEAFSTTTNFAIPGTKVVADFPLQMDFYYACSDHGSYEDGSLQYEVIPETWIGDDYYLPIAVNQLAILSITDGTSIDYDADNDGIPENTYALDQGEQQLISAVAGSHLSANNAFYLVAANSSPTGYDNTFAFAVMPANTAGTYYISCSQHPYGIGSATDNSGVHLVAVQDGVTVTIGASNQTLDAGDVWFYPTTIEQEISADGPVVATYLSSVTGMDPWDHVMRPYEWAIPLFPEAYGINKFYIISSAATPQGSPLNRLFLASYADGNVIDFECLVSGGTYQTMLNRGDSFYMEESDLFLPCWVGERTLVTSTEPVQGGFTRRGWWNNISETTYARAYSVRFCECTLDAECDDGLFCTGLETCGDDCQCEIPALPCPDNTLFCDGTESCDEDLDVCVTSGDPCQDNALFCDGSESCDEDLDACVSSGEPCNDNALFCDGSESCDEDLDACVSSGDPCQDNALFCDGSESCDEDQDACVSSGNPCPEDETCDEVTDTCVGQDDDLDLTDDDDDTSEGEENLWPRGKVTGGCCGC